MMVNTKRRTTNAALLVIFALAFAVVANAQSTGKKVMWEKVNIPSRDTFYGPGGKDMVPDVSKVEYLRTPTGGTSKKYRVRDARGQEWVAKIDKEDQPETASVRLVWAIGYKTEINYFVPAMTIPTKGDYKNVRVEGRPPNVKRGEYWPWEDNPFNGTRELDGLKIMSAMLNNWDIKTDNNIILIEDGVENYIISDYGATFGNYGCNNTPLLWKFCRSINKPDDYAKSKFIVGRDGDNIVFANKGKNTFIWEGIPVSSGRWLADLLLQLTDKQIDDAFRAAGYTPAQINTLANAFKDRIRQLDEVSK